MAMFQRRGFRLTSSQTEFVPTGFAWKASSFGHTMVKEGGGAIPRISEAEALLRAAVTDTITDVQHERSGKVRREVYAVGERDRERGGIRIAACTLLLHDPVSRLLVGCFIYQDYVLNAEVPGLSKRSRGKSSKLNPRWVTRHN